MAEQARKEMAEALPVMIELLNNPTFVAEANSKGYQFDALAIFRAFRAAAEEAGWKFSSEFARPLAPGLK